MNDDEDRLASLERQMEATMRRLAALEGTPPLPDPGEAPRDGPAEEARVRGTVAYAGSLRLGQRRLRMRAQEDMAEVLDAEPAVAARLFAALGSPFRLQLLHALLERARTSRELQAVLDVGPVGQLYHHLKELLAAGLVTQRKRGLYAIHDEKVLLICLMLAAARRLTPDLTAAPGIVEQGESKGSGRMDAGAVDPHDKDER